MKITKRYIDAVFILIALIGILTGIGFLAYSYYDFIDTTKRNNIVRPSNLNKAVLFISSYSESYPYTREQMKGFNAVFGKYDIPYDSAFMDTKVYNTSENLDKFFELIKYKMSVHAPYRAIIAGDDPALDFILDHYDELFSDIPIIFLGINDEDLAEKAAKYPKITGSTEHLDLDGLFGIISRLFPDRKNIAVIYDDANLTTLGFKSS